MRTRVKGNTGRARPTKRVIDAPPSETPERYLVWRFGRLDHDGKFASLTLARSDVPDLERELVAFQDESIDALLKRRWLKFVPVSDMTRDGQQRFGEINKQEEGLWQLHLGRNKWRVWGYFERPEFFFLWWDSEHAVATGKSRNRRKP